MAPCSWETPGTNPPLQNAFRPLCVGLAGFLRPGFAGHRCGSILKACKLALTFFFLLGKFPCYTIDSSQFWTRHTVNLSAACVGRSQAHGKDAQFLPKSQVAGILDTHILYIVHAYYITSVHIYITCILYISYIIYITYIIYIIYMIYMIYIIYIIYLLCIHTDLLKAESHLDAIPN